MQYYYQNTRGDRRWITTRIRNLEFFVSRRARKELYEVPGGYQVDGLPPVPIPRRALRHR